MSPVGPCAIGGCNEEQEACQRAPTRGASASPVGPRDKVDEQSAGDLSQHLAPTHCGGTARVASGLSEGQEHSINDFGGFCKTGGDEVFGGRQKRGDTRSVGAAPPPPARPAPPPLGPRVARPLTHLAIARCTGHGPRPGGAPQAAAWGGAGAAAAGSDAADSQAVGGAGLHGYGPRDDST